MGNKGCTVIRDMQTSVPYQSMRVHDMELLQCHLEQLYNYTNKSMTRMLIYKYRICVP